MNNNKIKKLEPFTFLNLINLNVIDLSANHLHSIESDLFVGMESIIDINLSANKIDYIDKYTFYQLTQTINRIDLRSNPIAADGDSLKDVCLYLFNCIIENGAVFNYS
jgi:hypothetical protein